MMCIGLKSLQEDNKPQLKCISSLDRNEFLITILRISYRWRIVTIVMNRHNDE